MRFCFKFLVIFVLTLTKIDCARILAYFPIPSISHQVVFRPITQELARRGHEVFVITTDPAYPKNKAPANLTEIDVHAISYKLWEKVLPLLQDQKEETVEHYRILVGNLSEIFKAQIETPEVGEILKKDKKYFDILLLENCSRLVLRLGHKFDAPIISLSSFGALSFQYSYMGAAIHPILYPTPDRTRLYNLTLIEKTVVIFRDIMSRTFYNYFEELENEILRQHFGNDLPTVTELEKLVKMTFLNEHPLWVGNRPVPPNVVYMGGIHASPEKKLPKELQQYLDSSTNGFIYISFGTNVRPSVLPIDKIRVITKVISQLPYNVLWKWDNDILPGQSHNINISKWFPQSDLLRHPNIKLFITQGGLQSTDEAINAEVPLIGIPVFADQWYNVEKYVYHGIGMQIDIESLSEDKLKQSIITVIEDDSYKKNIVKLKERMRQQPIKPLDLVVFWIEYIIKYGGDHLKTPAAGMSWIEYYEVKLLLLILSILVVITFVFIIILKSLFAYLTKLFKNKLKLKSS